MKHLASYRREHQSLIGCEVEFDLRPAARSRRDWPAVSDLCLAIWLAARIVVMSKSSWSEGMFRPDCSATQATTSPKTERRKSSSRWLSSRKVKSRSSEKR
jgi:hypothetical protein